MRAAGAEVRGALAAAAAPRAGAAGLALERRQAVAGALGQRGRRPSTRPSARATSSAPRVARAGSSGRPSLVVLADDQRGAGRAVQRLLELALQERQLVLDDQHRSPGRRSARRSSAGVQRPRHAELHQPQARARPARASPRPEVVERAQHGLVSHPGGERRRCAACAGSKTTRFSPAARAYCAGQLEPRVDQVVLGRQVRGRQQRPAARSRARGRQLGMPARAARRASTVALASAMSATIFSPAHSPLCARQRDGVQPVGRRSPATEPGASSGTSRLRHIGSHELGTVEDLLAGSSPISATAPPSGGGAGEVAVADGVGGAVEAGVLAVPEAGDPVVAAAGELRRAAGCRPPRWRPAPR